MTETPPSKQTGYNALEEMQRKAIDYHLARHVNRKLAELPERENEWREQYAALMEIDPGIRVLLVEDYKRHLVSEFCSTASGPSRGL